MQIAYDRYSMILNGRREIIRSGAMHYFRLPSQDLWYDRLCKLKAAGYNTVDLYFNWGFHSEEEGRYDFTGICDIKRLLEMTRELGLWVIARPGPYINAEVSGGGFPMWLLAKKQLPLRNRRDGAFVWSDEYMRYVREWWEQILPFVNASGNVLMCQIENEYSTFEMEPDTMQALYAMARELGVTVPLSHNDLFIAGLYADIVDLYGFDSYSVTSFDQNWRTMPGVFAVLDNIERTLRPFCPERPLMVSELQAGWFGSWKGPSYDQIIEHLGREHIAITTKSLIGQGLTVFNHYKAIGGTNWGYLGSVESYTSYDFGAPISEAGLNTERLYETKALNYLLSSFDIAATDHVEVVPVSVTPAQFLYTVRANHGHPDQCWFFLRNMTPHEAMVNLGGVCDVMLRAHEVQVLPWRMPLSCGLMLRYVSSEPLWQSEKILVLKADRPVVAEFSGNATPSAVDRKSVLSWQPADDGGWRLQCPALPPEGLQITSLGPLTIALTGSFLADTAWLDNDRMIFGAEARLPGTYGVRQSRCLHVLDTKTGALCSRDVIAPKAPVLPRLTNWRLLESHPSGLDVGKFRPVSFEGLDFDANRHFEGCGWYAIPLGKKRIKTVSLMARHIWAVYLNDRFLSHGHQMELVHGQDPPAYATFTIPQDAYVAQGPNTLWVFVDSLGHYKGFHDDEQVAQGLVELVLDDDDVHAGDHFEVLFYGEPGWQARKGPDGAEPLMRMETVFALPVRSDLEWPVGLNLGEPDFEHARQVPERINIILNDVLVGRWWRECRSQRRFYLPEGILKRDGENRLALEVMRFNPPLEPKDLDTLLAGVRLVSYDVLSRIEV